MKSAAGRCLLLEFYFQSNETLVMFFSMQSAGLPHYLYHKSFEINIMHIEKLSITACLCD